MTNYYELLNINSNADINRIKKAFRREAGIYHPDNNGSAEAKERFEFLLEAFDILSDDEKRKVYDDMLKSQSSNKPVIIEQKEQYKSWQQEAKTKSKSYEGIGIDELLLLDIFVLNGDVLDGILSGDLIEGLSDGLGDIFDLF